jgi:hypothetical protein
LILYAENASGHWAPRHIHQIGGVGPVKNSERRFQSNSMGILAQNASSDGVERASPRQVELTDAHGCCDFFPAFGARRSMKIRISAMIESSKTGSDAPVARGSGAAQ